MAFNPAGKEEEGALSTPYYFLSHLYPYPHPILFFAPARSSINATQ